MLAATRLGLVREQAPTQITDRLLQRFGLADAVSDEATRDALAAANHVAFGAVGGAGFALLTKRLPRSIPLIPAGMAYALGIWAISYAGWAPALRLMPPPEKDEARPVEKRAPEVSVEHQKKKTAKTLKVAILAADGYDHAAVEEVRSALEKEGARAKIVSKFLGTLQGEGGQVEVDKAYVTTASVEYDAVFIPGGRHVETLKTHGEALHWINETFKHCKPVGATGEGVELLEAARLEGVRLANGDDGVVAEQGVVTLRNGNGGSVTDRVKSAVGIGDDLDGFAGKFVEALAEHRHWGRTQKEMVPA